MSWFIALLFTLVYLAVAFFLTVLGKMSGPKLFPSFVLGFLALALAALWCLCFFLTRRKPKSASVILTLGGIGIGVLLIAASYAVVDPLLSREITQSQQLADATQVFNMQDEPLLFADRAPIGVRLKYSMRFPDSNNYWQTPFLYAQDNPRHIIGWNIVGETIEPPMQVRSAPAPTVPVEIAQVPPAARRYVQGTVYTFTVDLLPDFFVLSADRSRICINPYATTADTLQKLLPTQVDTTYLITVAGTNFRGPTQNRYNLKTFYESALQAGASACEFRDGKLTFQ